METKQCSQCKEIKTIDKFYPNYNKKDGTTLSHCKKCRYVKYYRPIALKRLAKKGKKPRIVLTDEDRKIKQAEAQRAYRNTEAGKATKKRYRDKLRATKPVTVKSPKIPKIKSTEQLELEKQKAKEYRRKYHERTYVKKGRPTTDLATKKVARNIRKRLKKQLDKGMTVGPTIEMLGCSIAQFRAYIEQQFTDVMTWDNYGTIWHIDHIKPVCSFDLSLEGIAKEVNHYSNLRPLLVEDNLAKSREDVTLKFKKD